MADGTRDELKRRYDEREASAPMDKIRWFLRAYVSDAESMDEVRRDLRRQLRLPALVPGQNTRNAIQGLDFVLGAPQPDGTLSKLVAWEANWVLDDPTDTGARRWLEELVEMLKEELKASGARTRWLGEK